MKNTKMSWFYLVLVLIIGFAGGAWLSPSLGLSRAPADAPKGVQKAAETQTSTPAQQMMDNISRVFEQSARKVSPSVVAITAEQVVQAQSAFGMPDDAFKDFFGEDFFKRFFEQPPQEQKRTVRSLGSGVIVSADGYILTNNHVVANADKLFVVIGDKQNYPAKVVGTDPQTDVAVVRIDAKDLPAATLGNSDAVSVGQWVIAIGNPFQLMHTVTAGIISAKGRSSVGLADYEDFFQTDASINPGNSGGALADLNGNVIGINTAIASPSGGNIGIGFAIPINMAKQVMESLISKGKVVRGFIGITPQDINENLARAFDLKSTEGVLVGDVTPKGPADQAGIKRGDVILSINGKKVANATQLRLLIADTAPKTEVKMTLLRQGKTMDVTVTLAERPGTPQEQAPKQEPMEGQQSEKLGLALQDLTPDIAGQLGYDKDKGVLVADVAPGSPAEDAGLQRGDLIKEVNRAPVKSVKDFEKAIRSYKAGDVVALLVRRGPTTLFAGIKIPE
ncbi:MAG: DegQ family serine endoprotease [Candidatus Aminicenantales bacterium]